MTGRDVPTRQKSLSVAFSVIMVLSMVAVGMAGFAGSAAAETIESGDEATIAANPADQDSTDSTHTILIPNATDVDGTSSAPSFNVTYEGVDTSEIDPDSSSVTLNTFNSNGVHQSQVGATVDNREEVGNDVVVQFTADAQFDDLGDDEKVRITIDSIDHSVSSNVNANVSVDNDGATGSSFSADVGYDATLELPGPVELDDGSSTTTYHSVADAASAAGAEDTITVTEDVDEFASQSTEVAASGALTAIKFREDNQTLESTSSANITSSSDDAVSGEFIDIGDAKSSPDNVANGTTISGVDIVGIDTTGQIIQVDRGDNVLIEDSTIGDSSLSNGHAINDATPSDDRVTLDNNVIESGSGSDQAVFQEDGNATITNNEFISPSATALQLGDLATDASVVDNNDFSEVDSGVFVVTEGAEITNNQFNVTNGNGISTFDSFDTDNVLVSGNDLEASQDAGNGIYIKSGDGWDIENNNIDGLSGSNFNNGVVIEDSGSNAVGEVNVTGGEVVNVSSPGYAIDVDDNSDDVSGPVAITDVTIDQAVTGVNVNIPTTATQVDIDGLSVNGTDNGVDVVSVGQNADAVNITNNVFTQNADGVVFRSNADDTGARYDVHFNTFENNDDGVAVPSDPSADVLYNVTFNDFVDNNENGLNVPNGITTGSLNANYSWWGDRDYSRIVGPYTPQNAESQLPNPRRVYSYTRLHTGGQP